MPIPFVPSSAFVSDPERVYTTPDVQNYAIEQERMRNLLGNKVVMLTDPDGIQHVAWRRGDGSLVLG